MKSLLGFGLSLGVLTGAPAAAQEQEPFYDAKGRRDPFLNPAGPSTRERLSCPGPGLSGLIVQEVALRGIVRSREGRKALLLAPDGRTYFATEGSRLCDGRLSHIDADGIVFVQRLRDPLGPERDVEVRRPVHPER